jgi:type IV secretory pathway TraG/TraD family ATPase VirD4
MKKRDQIIKQIIKMFGFPANLLFKASVYLLDTLSEIANQFWEAITKTDEYNSELGSESDISSRWNTRGFLISSRGRKIPFRKSCEGVLVVAPTGAGKTQRVLLPALFEYLLENKKGRPFTLFVNDPSGEIRSATAHFAYWKCGFKIHDLNFSNSKRSSGYNILKRIHSKSDVVKIANILTRSVLGTQSNDPFWTLRSQSLIGWFIRLTLSQKDKSKHNIASTLELFKQFSAKEYEMIDELVSEADQDLMADYRALLTTPEKVLQSIVETASACFAVLDTPDIQKITSKDGIDFEDLRVGGAHIVYIGNSVTNQELYRSLNSILYEQLYSTYLSRLPKKEENPVVMFLEESSSIFIPILPIAVSNSRKHEIINVIVTQNKESLEKFYGQNADTIFTNLGTQIFLGGNHSLNLLKTLETLSGRYTYEDEKKNKKVRSNLSLEQIRTLDPSKAIVLQGNKSMVISRVKPAYRHWKYSHLMKYPELPYDASFSAKRALDRAEELSQDSDES